MITGSAKSIGKCEIRPRVKSYPPPEISFQNFAHAIMPERLPSTQVLVSIDAEGLLFKLAKYYRCVTFFDCPVLTFSHRRSQGVHWVYLHPRAITEVIMG